MAQLLRLIGCIPGGILAGAVAWLAGVFMFRWVMAFWGLDDPDDSPISNFIGSLFAALIAGYVTVTATHTIAPKGEKEFPSAAFGIGIILSAITAFFAVRRSDWVTVCSTATFFYGMYNALRQILSQPPSRSTDSA